MRTTIEISDNVYMKLVKYSLEKYRTTKKISNIINSILKEKFLHKKKILDSVFGIWKDEKPNLREISKKEWNERLKRYELFD